MRRSLQGAPPNLLKVFLRASLRCRSAPRGVGVASSSLCDRPPPRAAFVPETVLASRKRRDALRAEALAARKAEKSAGKVRRAGELKRAEAYLKGAFSGCCAGRGDERARAAGSVSGEGEARLLNLARLCD